MQCEMLCRVVLLLCAVTSALCWTKLMDFEDDNSTQLESRQAPPVDNPCNCYFKDSCGCICSRPITWSQFQLLPQNFVPGCRGFTLALRGGNFHSFPGDYFHHVGRVGDFVLDVHRASMQYFADPESESSPFNGVRFETSAYIRMHEVSVSRRWNWDAFSHLSPANSRAYCEIQVVKSSVPALRGDFGRICQGAVTVANVVASGVANIDNRVFAPFARLQEVDLSGNRIVEMKRAMFSFPAREIEIINLSNNQIRSLPTDMFSQMPSLQSVHLGGNPLARIDERTFRPIFRTVEILGMESFPLSCDCHARWLREPSEICGPNIFALADTVCTTPTQFKGKSLFNDTLPKELVCY